MYTYNYVYIQLNILSRATKLTCRSFDASEVKSFIDALNLGINKYMYVIQGQFEYGQRFLTLTKFIYI